MKIFKKSGTKDRLVEVFERVNEVKLNEMIGDSHNMNNIEGIESMVKDEEIIKEDNYDLKDTLYKDFKNLKIRDKIPKRIVAGANVYELIEDTLKYDGFNEEVTDQPQVKFTGKYKLGETIFNLPFVIVVELRQHTDGYNIDNIIYVDYENIDIER